mmetsp:Transcript_136/g.355  ORF Transcript_136/g.355 Transcript_136/m.355 type:complete len:215 (-) Transcript_136:1184-1828(-)
MASFKNWPSLPMLLSSGIIVVSFLASVARGSFSLELAAAILVQGFWTIRLVYVSRKLSACIVRLSQASFSHNNNNTDNSMNVHNHENHHHRHHHQKNHNKLNNAHHHDSGANRESSSIATVTKSSTSGQVIILGRIFSLVRNCSMSFVLFATSSVIHIHARFRLHQTRTSLEFPWWCSSGLIGIHLAAALITLHITNFMLCPGGGSLRRSSTTR